MLKVSLIEWSQNNVQVPVSGTNSVKKKIGKMKKINSLREITILMRRF